MIDYEYFRLSNGLRVYVHKDKSTPMAVLNILYNVGSRDEDSDKTGFAHLFEHLMFGGSANIPTYDQPLQKAGGENNAFTSPDLTNYYITLPSENLETAFWLESDRMLGLSFDPKVLEIQRKVVIEEFKQRYLNQPYGEVWLHLRPLAYKVHPYKWATIGKEISHIEQANMADVKSFFSKYYIPNNAILVVAGNVELEEVKNLAQKWFEPIPAGQDYQRNLPIEPKQTQKRTITVPSKVPSNAIYKTYHVVDRLHKDYYAADLVSDMLGRGHSSRLYQQLVKEQKLFSTISGYIMSSNDPGLLVVEGKMNDTVTFAQAEQAIDNTISDFMNDDLEEELLKVKNQAESSIIMAEIDLLNRAMNIAFAANLGNVDMVNQESAMIQAVTQLDVKRVAKEIFCEENSSVLYFQKEQ